MFDPTGGSPPGYWGDVTSTIDWCESNYQVTQYLAEFWNAVSSLAMVAFAVYGWWLQGRTELRYSMLQLAVGIVGVGSFLFHGTLQYHMQLLDELPMVMSMLVWWYLWIEAPHKRQRHQNLPAALTVYGCGWSVLHGYFGLTTLFQIHFGVMIGVGLWFVGKAAHRTKLASVRRLAFAYVAALAVAFTCWIVDRAACETVRGMQLHAWWHVLVGFE